MIRTKAAGAVVWRLMDPRRLTPVHEGARRLKNLQVLVEVRCSAKGHELAYVYRLPADAITAQMRTSIPDLDGRLLFVSTDTQRWETGSMWGVLDGERIDLGDLGQAKRDRRTRLGGGWATSLRRWQPLVDLLDYRPDEAEAHAALISRCRCGERQELDRAELIKVAAAAMTDGSARRVFA